MLVLDARCAVRGAPHRCVRARAPDNSVPAKKNAWLSFVVHGGDCCAATRFAGIRVGFRASPEAARQHDSSGLVIFRWFAVAVHCCRHGRTLHRAPVSQGPSGLDRLEVALPLPLGFGLDGRLLLARRGRVYV